MTAGASAATSSTSRPDSRLQDYKITEARLAGAGGKLGVFGWDARPNRWAKLSEHVRFPVHTFGGRSSKRPNSRFQIPERRCAERVEIPTRQIPGSKFQRPGPHAQAQSQIPDSRFQIARRGQTRESQGSNSRIQIPDQGCWEKE